MNKRINIKVLTGFNELEFGSSKQDFIELMGTTESIEVIEEEEEFLTEMHTFESLKSSFFFEGTETEMLFTSCDTDCQEAELFGNKVFTLSEIEIMQLMQEHNFKELEVEEEEWGEKRLSYLDAMVDFYFVNEELVSITWGILVM